MRRTIDPLLVRLPALAERYVFEDPNSALIKLRQFAELLAEQCAAHAGIALEERDTFLTVLDKLWAGRVTESQTAQLFHGLRKAGNRAAHTHEEDRSEALHQLRMARSFTVELHKACSSIGVRKTIRDFGDWRSKKMAR